MTEPGGRAMKTGVREPGRAHAAKGKIKASGGGGFSVDRASMHGGPTEAEDVRFHMLTEEDDSDLRVIRPKLR